MIPLKDDPPAVTRLHTYSPLCRIAIAVNHLSLELPRPSSDPNGRLAPRSRCRSRRSPAERAPEPEIDRHNVNLKTALLNVVLSFLLFAGAMHVDLNELRKGNG
jgi:hypothetical protein